MLLTTQRIIALSCVLSVEWYFLSMILKTTSVPIAEFQGILETVGLLVLFTANQNHPAYHCTSG